MCLVRPLLSHTANNSPVHKAGIRSKELPSFCLIPNSIKPFFKQWHLHIIDMVKIMAVSRAEAREVMQDLRNKLGKSKKDVITVDEFCAFTGISKGYVRMHLVSRQMEHDILRQTGLSVTSCKF